MYRTMYFVTSYKYREKTVASELVIKVRSDITDDRDALRNKKMASGSKEKSR